MDERWNRVGGVVYYYSLLVVLVWLVNYRNFFIPYCFTYWVTSISHTNTPLISKYFLMMKMNSIPITNEIQVWRNSPGELILFQFGRKK